MLLLLITLLYRMCGLDYTYHNFRPSLCCNQISTYVDLCVDMYIAYYCYHHHSVDISWEEGVAFYLLIYIM